MSTLERLFMNVFDRKQWIIDQVQQQFESYEDSLACHLAARGREIPTWLFADGSQSRSRALMPDSVRTELNRKQNITDLLFPPSQATAPANRNPCFPIPSDRSNQSFQDGHLTGACPSDNRMKSLLINDKIPSISLEVCTEEQSQIQPEVTDMGALSTIQRSRSRQKDIEKRSSVKKAPIDTTASFRKIDTKTENLDMELVETSDLCRRGDAKEMQQQKIASSACQIMNTDLIDALGCVQTGIVSPEHLALDAAVTVSMDNLDSVTENHDETMNQRSHFHVVKDLSSPVGKSRGVRQGEKRREVEILEISASHLVNPVLTETACSMKNSACEPKRLGFSLALTSFDKNLDSVVDNHGEIGNGSSRNAIGETSGVMHSEEMIEGVETLVEVLSPQITSQELTPNSMVNDVKLKVLSFDEPSDRPSALPAKGLISPKIVGQSGPRETEAELHGHKYLLPDGVRGEEESNEENLVLVESTAPGMMDSEELIKSVKTLVKELSPQITAQELTSTPNSMVNEVKLKISSLGEPRDRTRALTDEGFLSPERPGQNGPREMEAVLHGHNSLLPDGVRGHGQRNEEICGLVKSTSPGILNTEPTKSPFIEGLHPLIKQSFGDGSDVREVEETFYARDSYSPTVDVSGGKNLVSDVNEPMVSRTDISDITCKQDQSLRRKGSELESLLLSQPMEVVGDEVLDLSEKRSCPLASSSHEASRPSSSLSGSTFGSCQSHLTTPDNIVAHLEKDTKSVGTNLKSVSTDPKAQGEGRVKCGEGIKHLSSGGRYLLQSSDRPEKSNVSVLRDGIVTLDNLDSSGGVRCRVSVNSWPKRRKMEVFSDFAFATSPRPRKRLGPPKTSYSQMEEDESEASAMVLEEFNRIPSMSSFSADNGKAPVSPMVSDIGSPTLVANQFSISPKDGDVANAFTFMPKVDAYSAQEDDLANSSKYAHEINVGASMRYHSGSFVDQEGTGPEMEAFTMGISSDSEGESGKMPETIPLRMERASLIEQLSFSQCNLATPGSCFSTKYKLDPHSDVYKSLPTGQLDFMKTCEALSVPVNDRKQLSASVSAISYESGLFGYPGFEMGRSTSKQSDRGRPTTSTPAEKVGYKRGIPPLTPPAQKYSYRMLSEKDETGNGSEKGSGTRSFGKTPLYPELTCFRIDEDAAEDDIPNDNDALEPQDLSAVLEESTLPSVKESHNFLEDNGPIYMSNLQDTTDVLENTKAGGAIPENFAEEGGHTGKKPKEGAASLNKREIGTKASGSMRSGLATTEIHKGQEKSMGTVSSKPGNIASGVTSFLPLVKQKQQPTAKKREVRIPALEAAEANKRLEEKKRNERAAIKAEREKMIQEKILKKKQEEGQKKKEADIVTKKRQREEREKKEKDKEKKRKCTEMDRQTQREEPTKKEPPKIAHVAREEEELQHSVVDEQEQSKIEECEKEDTFTSPRGTGPSIIIVDDAVDIPELSRVVEKSYEMSPYKDSDAEGDDGLDEVEEDKIRRKKFIPSWARKEFLEDYLQSKKYLNPEMIFSCKCSFDLTTVLKPRNQKQRL